VVAWSRIEDLSNHSAFGLVVHDGPLRCGLEAVDDGVLGGLPGPVVALDEVDEVGDGVRRPRRRAGGSRFADGAGEGDATGLGGVEVEERQPGVGGAVATAIGIN
jgi:hypothetical protein